ncbi:MAG TPA: PilZ domain-containing protein [Parvularculaceae bacterium]|nr:PilZ domain-containing protein [Parvularculaceae bacterium]
MQYPQKKPTMAKNDYRRYRRIPVDLPARIVVNGIDEYQGVLVNISPGDLAVNVPAKVVVGDAAVVHASGLDVIEGTVVRVIPDGFALSFLLSRRRRATLTEQLMLRANADLSADLRDQRVSPRHFVGEQRMVCRMPDGTSLFVKLLDRSVEGVSVDAPRKPEIGSVIHVGRTRAVVVRHTARGFAAVFQPAAGELVSSRLRAV